METTFIWAAAHEMTPEQESTLNGSIKMLKDIDPQLHNELCNLSKDSDLVGLVWDLLKIAEDAILVQPAGSPVFQNTLGVVSIMKRIGSSLDAIRIAVDTQRIIYAYSKRVSQDIPQPDGSIKKISTFKHEGWV